MSNKTNLECIAHLTESLNRAETQADAFFQLCPEPLCILGEDGTFVRLNNAWEKSLGWKIQDLEETHPHDLVHPEDKKLAAKLWQDAQKNQGGWENGEVVRYRTSDGDYRPFSWRLTIDQNGYAYVCARDVSDFVEFVYQEEG